jgi:hypothetical protein
MPVPGRSRFPFLLRLAVALTLLNSWVLFEEIVVDRLGWWRFMPCYRVGRFCEWDVAAILVILLVTAVGFSEKRAPVVERLRRSCAGLGCRFCLAPSVR